MRGLMMDQPLLITSLIKYAAQYHGDTDIVSRTVEGPVHRYTYRDAYNRIQQLAHALISLDLGRGDRIATLAWNGYRHFELYYAISGIGAVCHTVNPRLFPAQIEYILNHAEDKYIFVDLSFVPLMESLAPRLKHARGVIVMTDAAHKPATALPHVLCYEELIEGRPEGFDWPSFDERTASSMCYTPGTPGNPKGVLYAHRSTVLHSFSITSADSMALTAPDTAMPIVPLFHVNAWGIPYGAPLAGSKLVFPGPHLDPANLLDLLEREQVTMAAAVPTVWLKVCEMRSWKDQRSEEHTSELQSPDHLVCRLLLEKKNNITPSTRGQLVATCSARRLATGNWLSPAISPPLDRPHTVRLVAHCSYDHQDHVWIEDSF